MHVGTAGRSARLGLIVNANARGVKRRYGRRPFWESRLPAEHVRSTADLEELNDAVASFSELGVNALAVLGGDGSVHHLIEAVVRHYAEDEAPMLLALAGGTLNGVPRALGTGDRPERVLADAIEALESENAPVRVRRVLEIEDRMTGRTRYGISLAAGLVYRVHQRYYRYPNPGLLQAVAASTLPIRAAIFRGTFYDDVGLEVAAGGKPWLEPSPHTVLASIVPNPLLWFRPFRSELGGDESFHFGAVSMPPGELALRLWSVSRGTCRSRRFRAGEADEVKIRGKTGYIIDGDLYPGGEGEAELDVRITSGPPFRFLEPVGSQGDSGGSPPAPEASPREMKIVR